MAAVLLAMAGTGCTAPASQRGKADKPPSATEPASSTLAELGRAGSENRWRFDVVLSDDGRTLHVVGDFDADSAGAELHVDSPAGNFIEKVEMASADGWSAAKRVGERWKVSACAGGKACRVRYEFALGQAAEELGDVDLASEQAGAFLSPPSAWLLRPLDGDGVPFLFRVQKHPEFRFVTGVWPNSDIPDSYGGDAGYLWRSPYSAFGKFRAQHYEIAEGSVDIAIAQGGRQLHERDVLAWLKDSAETVGTVFGRFPVPRVLVLVLPRSRARIHGRQIGGGGVSIMLNVGEDATAAEFRGDWVAVHEMIHLAVPMMRRDKLWLTEGLSTYLEPLARARRGKLDEREVWRGMLKGMRHGRPAEGDRGLDRTHSWGRTYWGGALFWMVADLAIRKQTKGARSIDDGLRSVVAKGGNNGVWWGIDRFLSVCDEATGTHVLRDLYAAWKHAPVDVDLDEIYRRLGVAQTERGISFDDNAPDAALRRALVTRL
jgi:predicted metalloprotease with PDZ domain